MQVEYEKNNSTHDDGIDLGMYYRIVRRRKFTIIGFIVLFLIIGIVYLKNSTPIYEASSKIQADPVQPNATAQDTYVMNSMIYLFYETQYEIVKSRKVAERVVDKLGLVEKYKAKLAIEESNENENFFAELKQGIKSLLVEAEDENPNIMTDAQIKTMLAQSIQSNLKVSGGTQSQIINISIENEDPTLAANIVNAISDSYIEFGLEARLSQIKDTAEWLSDQLEDLRVALQDSEERLQQFRISQNLMDTEQQQRIANTQFSTLNTELVRAQTQLSEAENLYNQVITVERNGGDYFSIGPVLQSNTIRDLIREETNQSRKVDELSERYGNKHPKMIAALSDLRAAKANILRETNKIIDNIKKQYRSAELQEENIKKLIAESRSQLQTSQGDSFELTRLEREVENNRRVYESFLSKLMEADVSGDYDASNIRIIDKATIPEVPVKPRAILIILASIVAGGAIGVLAAFTKELTSNVFRTPDQLEEILRQQTLGITPFVKKQKGAFVPEMKYLEDTRSTFSEEINTIRTGLIFSDIEKQPQTILITSTSGSEGKTTLSTNLAMALSQLDKTLLIEMDLRKPAIAKDLGITAKFGITDHVIGNTQDISINKIDKCENLDILICGTIPKNPGEIILSSKLENLIESFKKKYKYIIIDSPPTLPVSDSCVLSKKVDATIVAVKAEGTKISMVKETLSRLYKVKANVVGLVLTQASAEKMSYYGEHYYRDSYYGEK